jgi:hypothetical protein
MSLSTSVDSTVTAWSQGSNLDDVPLALKERTLNPFVQISRVDRPPKKGWISRGSMSPPERTFLSETMSGHSATDFNPHAVLRPPLN